MKKLYIITSHYPNDVMGDTPFIRNEIDYLSKKYDVTVFCMSFRHNKQVKHDNVDVHYLNNKVSSSLPYMPLCLFDPVFYEDIREIKRFRPAMLRYARMILSSAYFLSNTKWIIKRIKRVIPKNEEAIIYSFWSFFPIVSLLKGKNVYPGCKYITRMHGTDLYDEQHHLGRLPYRRYINDNIDRLVFVGETGLKYYTERHPELDVSKTAICRLGVAPIDNSKASKPGDEMLLVSCSSLLPVKRVELIIEALSRYDGDADIRWVHFGDGPMMGSLKDMADRLLNDNEKITYEFKGFVKNDEIRRFYSNTIVDCFITTSSSEGCPVSVMEALSVGTPVIGTSVGDIPYMINDNGVLLSRDPDVNEIVTAIEGMMAGFIKRKENTQYMEMRERSKELYNELFNTHKNVETFEKEVLDKF